LPRKKKGEKRKGREGGRREKEGKADMPVATSTHLLSKRKKRRGRGEKREI